MSIKRSGIIISILILLFLSCWSIFIFLHNSSKEFEHVASQIIVGEFNHGFVLFNFLFAIGLFLIIRFSNLRNERKIIDKTDRIISSVFGFSFCLFFFAILSFSILLTWSLFYYNPFLCVIVSIFLSFVFYRIFPFRKMINAVAMYDA